MRVAGTKFARPAKLPRYVLENSVRIEEHHPGLLGCQYALSDITEIRIVLRLRPVDLTLSLMP